MCLSYLSVCLPVLLLSFYLLYLSALSFYLFVLSFCLSVLSFHLSILSLRVLFYLSIRLFVVCSQAGRFSTDRKRLAADDEMPVAGLMLSVNGCAVRNEKGLGAEASIHEFNVILGTPEMATPIFCVTRRRGQSVYIKGASGVGQGEQSCPLHGRTSTSQPTNQ